MLSHPAPHAVKKATNLTLTVSTLERAKELGMNISQTVDALLAEEVKRQYWANWNARNAAAIDAYNARVASEGLPLAKYRTFARNPVDDGQGDR
jgi:antitoxin CcdA